MWELAVALGCQGMSGAVARTFSRAYVTYFHIGRLPDARTLGRCSITLRSSAARHVDRKTSEKFASVGLRPHTTLLLKVSLPAANELKLIKMNTRNKEGRM